MLPQPQRTVLNRLKTARGHLDGIMRMVEDEAYCPNLMKQLAAVQGMLEGTSRVIFRNHLETCVADAMREGRTEQVLDELMETLKYDKRVLRPLRDPIDDSKTASKARVHPNGSRSQHD